MNSTTQFKPLLDVEEKPKSYLQWALLSLQHVFAMFGASILVPALFNSMSTEQVVDPGLVLLMNGIGTLIYFFVTKGKSPAYLGSSFAFIAPTSLIITGTGDFGYALGGYIVSGLTFALVALVVKMIGTNWINVVLPPAAMGPITALIGLELASTAASMAGWISVDGTPIETSAVIVSSVTLLTVIVGSLVFRKFLAIIPILIGVIVGYLVALSLGIVDYSTVSQAAFFRIPNFVSPKFSLSAIIIIFPATLVVLSEHVSHLVVSSKIINRDLLNEPGLHRSLLGDGISTMVSGFAGSCPTTTYGENMGVMAITKVYSVWVIVGAAIVSICLGMIGTFSALVSTIPVPVIGGVSILLFGVIAASGIRMIVESNIDYTKSKNLILTAITFVVGLSGASIKVGEVEFTGMVLAAIVAIVLSVFIHVLGKFNLLADDVDHHEM